MQIILIYLIHSKARTFINSKVKVNIILRPFHFNSKNVVSHRLYKMLIFYTVYQ